jgi:hypothetical protein
MLLLSFLSLYGWRKKIAWLLAGPIAMSTASVLLTKQHYILDVVAAIPIAITAFVFVTKKYGR